MRHAVYVTTVDQWKRDKANNLFRSCTKEIKKMNKNHRLDISKKNIDILIDALSFHLERLQDFK